MTGSARPRGSGVRLNGATIMTTATDLHLRIARETGYDGVEVRAERLLSEPAEVDRAADEVRPGEVWSLNGIQPQWFANVPFTRHRRSTRRRWLPIPIG